MDKSLYSYGLYIGLPIINNYDLIIKNSVSSIDQFDTQESSLSLNIPFSSRLTTQTYFGIKAGMINIIVNDYYKTKYALTDSKTKGEFYGISLGKKYKYTRHYYSRFEIDYIKHNYKLKSTIENITPKYSVGLNYSFEYRF
jgi:hypothetical protein